MAKKNSIKPNKIKTPIEELEVLVALKESTSWAIAKRMAYRYIDNMVKRAFYIPENDNVRFSLEHARYKGQVEGIKTFLSAVDNAGKKLSDRKKK